MLVHLDVTDLRIAVSRLGRGERPPAASGEVYEAMTDVLRQVVGAIGRQTGNFEMACDSMLEMLDQICADTYESSTIETSPLAAPAKGE